MRKALAYLGLGGGALGAAALLRRRRREPRERIDLYYEDGSVVSFASSTDVAARLMPPARRVLASARG